MTTPLQGIPWNGGIDDRTAAIDANNLNAVTDSATDAEVSTAVALLVPKAGGTMTGELVVPDLSVAGLTGSVTSTRYVGGSNGAPTTGAHLVGDWVVDPTNACIWICTVAGTPGTWVSPSRKPILDRSAVATQVTQATQATADTGASITFTVTTKDVHVLGLAKSTGHTVAGQAAILNLTDAANAIKDTAFHTSATANALGGIRVDEYISTPGTYTRKLRIQNASATGSAYFNLNNGSATGTFLQAEEEDF